MYRPAGWLNAGILAAAIASPAWAQDRPGPLVTDRPDQTESTEIVPTGSVQIEAGWVFAKNDDGAAAVRVHTVPQALARIGLAPRVELRLGFAGWSRVERDGVGPPVVMSGAGDLDAGFKYRLADGVGARPAIALIGAVALPTANQGFGGERPDPTVRLAFANGLSERVALGYNVGVAVSSAPNGAGGTATFVDALYTLAFGFALAPGVGAFAESFGTLPVSGDVGSQHALDGGFTVLVSDNLQFDMSGGVGLNRAADDWFLGAGVALRIPR